jgi:hypothetical protein
MEGISLGGIEAGAIFSESEGMKKLKMQRLF